LADLLQLLKIPMQIHWAELFAPQTPFLEIFIRGSIIFLALFFFFRFVALRVSGSLSLNDILVIVLIADASQNAMAGNSNSITDGIFLVATILFWNFMIEAMEYYFKPLRRFLKAQPLLIVKDGAEVRQNMRKQLISHEELMEQLREQGIEDISEVRSAYLEDDGNISVLKKTPAEGRKNEQRDKKPWK